ncbi:sporulation histidine kinase inhibitor Sda [Fodinisporobacter ferrooxydans]|uniref:Sporulation histidine kinase inhibitor Sda n=1 Tax=Fodinisporobacter ferrooxydans TaxID=2901836 RepID=A0ABY4CMA7_9BACL|nr:sporulation histidine kinase inhibitor Sda [Alicyclobacillaceae bacterium MYW30-H2]
MQLSNDLLLEAYELSVDLKLEDSFIQLLFEEIKRRGLDSKTCN